MFIRPVSRVLDVSTASAHPCIWSPYLARISHLSPTFSDQVLFRCLQENILSTIWPKNLNSAKTRPDWRTLAQDLYFPKVAKTSLEAARLRDTAALQSTTIQCAMESERKERRGLGATLESLHQHFGRWYAAEVRQSCKKKHSRSGSMKVTMR